MLDPTRHGSACSSGTEATSGACLKNVPISQRQGSPADLGLPPSKTLLVSRGIRMGGPFWQGRPAGEFLPTSMLGSHQEREPAGQPPREDGS